MNWGVFRLQHALYCVVQLEIEAGDCFFLYTPVPVWNRKHATCPRKQGRAAFGALLLQRNGWELRRRLVAATLSAAVCFQGGFLSRPAGERVQPQNVLAALSVVVLS